MAASSHSLLAPPTTMRPTAATIRMPCYQGHPESSRPKMTTTDSFEATAADEDEDEKHDGDKQDHDSDSAPRRTSIDLQDLPIELISLTDSFIDSLGQKVHPTPPNIERLSQLFQEFYNVASSHVATHIKALATRQMRHQQLSSSSSSSSSASGGMMQQMMTAEELAERRKCRKQLETRRLYLEEAVERRLCEGIYHRIYRHPSTQDEAQDDKLRSKTAALALVGIGLSDLGVQVVVEAESQGKTNDDKDLVEAAHQHLIAMSESRYPLGKLNRLRAVHRSIVDALARTRPAASADELLPLLIYSLITLPPQHLHITSDLHFVQHFRHAHKLQGEEAYCLTNLEAAISFLQTVDLATLREDERLDGPPRSATSTPRAETFPPAYPTTPSRDPSVAAGGGGGGLKPPPSHHHPPAVVVTRGRSLSDLVNTPAQAFGAASGAVFNTADHGLKTISASLGDSYAFLVAKVRDGSSTNTSASSTSTTTSSSSSTNAKNVVTLPRTLDDARKLVTTPPPPPPPPPSQTDEAKQPTTATTTRREPPLDTNISNTASKSSSPSPSPSKSTSSPSAAKKSAAAAAALSTDDPSSKPQSPAAVFDQVRNLGSSFNPMARLSGISIRRFGRTSSSATVSSAKEIVAESSDGGELTEAFPDLADALPPKEPPPPPRPHVHAQAQAKVSPPIRRFIEVQDPSDLRLGEVQDLLQDYRRLASALRNMGALEES
ncbi:hypothetical protein CP533_6904 [Ophiocordyceps camponoti-saundersi (nom. inval.)]|nr:hypothetical protein CP533_6904 [Ophiocordyceps camponoti-saundersi (nom. inval.)]